MYSYVLGGLIARTPDDYVLTNNTWKCTSSFYEGWYKIGYNDSLWPAGFVGSRNGKSWPQISSFQKAHWIIDESDQKSPYSFYCRKNVIG